MSGAETRMLFRNIDAPGLATMDGYRRAGGYRAMERAFRELDPDELLGNAAADERGSLHLPVAE